MYKFIINGSLLELIFHIASPAFYSGFYSFQLIFIGSTLLGSLHALGYGCAVVPPAFFVCTYCLLSEPLLFSLDASFASHCCVSSTGFHQKVPTCLGKLY